MICKRERFDSLLCMSMNANEKMLAWNSGATISYPDTDPDAT